MPGNFLDKILNEEEDFVDEVAEEVKKFNWQDLIGPLIIFFLALVPRLYFLFTHDPQNPGFDWYGDVYHHWQIAYLSQTVGFENGFLRLWDFKGMEYFWGLLHPLASIFLFNITASVDIILIRLLSIVPASLVIVFIFLLVKRDFNASAAWASAIFLALFPVILFSDTLGMQEPLGLALLFGGILLWPKYGILTGLFWGLASMERAEYWLFSVGLVVAALLDKRKKLTDTKVKLFFSWLVVIIFYMKYLVTWTGNFIYPIYWNFLASVIGKWFAKEKVAYLPFEYYSQVKVIGAFVFVLAGLMALYFLWKRQRYYLWFLLGFLNLSLLGFMFSFAAYSRGYLDRFLVDRLFAWPYGFLGTLLLIFLFYILPLKFNLWGKLKLGWIVWLIILLASMLFWQPIKYYFEIAQKPWKETILLAEATAQHWDRKGKILVPEKKPDFVYALVHYHGVTGKDIIGQMFDPFYYIEGDPYQDWPKNRETILSWLKKENINLIVFSGGRYKELTKREPQYFKFEENPGGLMDIYQVKGL